MSMNPVRHTEIPGPTPPNTAPVLPLAPTPSEWTSSSMSSSGGDSPSLWGRCIAWIQNICLWFYNLFFSPKASPPKQEHPPAAPVSDQPLATDNPVQSGQEQPPLQLITPSADINKIKPSNTMASFTPGERMQRAELDEFIENFNRTIIKGSFRLLTSGSYVGADRKYRFGETIRLVNGAALKVDPLDCYCDSAISTKSTNSTLELPSCLFSQARHGNQVIFIQEEQLFLLDNVDRSLDTKLRASAQKASESMAVVRYDKDIPDDYFVWGRPDSGGGPLKTILSPSTKRIQLDIPGTISLDFSELSVLPSFQTPQMRSSLWKKDEERLFFLEILAWGQPTILLDGRRLMVLIDSSKTFERSPGMEVFNNTLPSYWFVTTMIPFEENRLDLKSITATFSNRGLIIQIPILKKPDTLPSLQDIPQE